ncbi:hypothetical protein BV22DRAFT_1132389 [Leucogyrophana mollusca]|uniref:Uncharacterized protein n=1 Tax=Leucogyrophana mollusca TaxID=85980 RepID=A0ACB8B756_9AGAM|nr:hypothetical protein BV22DRAFT_1132389 [Leucogyrophana mollusca]
MFSFLTLLFMCIAFFGFANATCAYEPDVNRNGDVIAWKFRVHTGTNCTGEHWEGFRGHQQTDYIGECSECLNLSPVVAGKIESFAFTTAGAAFDYDQELTMVLSVHLYGKYGCTGSSLGSSKGKWMENTSKNGKKLSSFKVCYEKEFDYEL